MQKVVIYNKLATRLVLRIGSLSAAKICDSLNPCAPHNK
jgi:hypothetical protein